MNLYITPPPGVKSSMIDCQISSNHLGLGIKGNPPFIDVREDTKRIELHLGWLIDACLLSLRSGADRRASESVRELLDDQ